MLGHLVSNTVYESHASPPRETSWLKRLIAFFLRLKI